MRLSSQCGISGTITDITQNPIPYANILVISKTDSSVIKFGFSDNNGNFAIIVDSSVINSGYITVSSLGFKDYTIDPFDCAVIRCILEPSISQIEEVVIRAHPVEVEGDTISYDARSFRKENDLVLADLLSHMPGIDISATGKISYQGKGINKFYIEGLDLMGGRYGLVNNALKADDVSSVQILKNHQPIKALEDVEFSDRAGINIKLKSKFSGAVSYDVGVGTPILLSDLSLTPMLFNKRIQTLNTISQNNAGKSLDYITLDYYDLIKKANDRVLEDSKKKVDIIGLTQPPIHKKYWLDNSSKAFSSNGLINLGKKGIVKLNASFVEQKYKMVGDRSATFDRIQDVLTLNELYNNQNQKDILNLDGTYEKNDSRLYIMNNLSLSKDISHKDGDISGDTNLNNEIDRDNIRAKNRFQSYIHIGQEIYNLSFLSDYQRRKQRLHYLTAQIDLEEELANDLIDIGPEISFTKDWKGFNLTPSIGFRYTKEKLRSDNRLNGNTSSTIANSLDSRYSHFVSSLKIERKVFKKIHLKISLPFNRVNFELENNIESDGSFKERRWLFLPAGSAYYQFNQRNDLSLSYGRNISYASIDHYTTQNINYSYRDIEVGNPSNFQSLNESIEVLWTHANTLDQRFLKVGLIAEWSKSPFILKNTINENGQLFKSYSQSDNTFQTISVMSRLSKKLFALNTLVRWTGNIGLSQFQSINNDVTGPVKGLNISSQIDVEIEPNRYSTLFLNFRGSLKTNIFEEVELNSFNDFSSELTYVQKISPSFSSEIAMSYYNISGILNRNISSMADAMLTYHVAKNKGRISVEVRNILNTKQYVYSEQDVTIQRFDSYNLRPRQIVLRFVSQL